MSNPFPKFQTIPPLPFLQVPHSIDSLSDLHQFQNELEDYSGNEVHFRSIEVSRLDIQDDPFSAESTNQVHRPASEGKVSVQGPRPASPSPGDGRQPDPD